MLWHLKARVNSHQRWKQTRFRVCFHLWCELTNTMTSTMNVTEWQISWSSRYSQLPVICAPRQHTSAIATSVWPNNLPSNGRQQIWQTLRCDNEGTWSHFLAWWPRRAWGFHAPLIPPYQVTVTLNVPLEKSWESCSLGRYNSQLTPSPMLHSASTGAYCHGIVNLHLMSYPSLLKVIWLHFHYSRTVTL